MGKQSRDETGFLQDFWDCIARIEEYLEGVTERGFENNFEKQDSVIRRIEIMGEAVKNISVETRQNILGCLGGISPECLTF